ncbi:secreted salivary gland peptide, putative [Ixodes scapularis]|uniref:Secreted salivary gland peptide, putative n=2 Tax=Ixodes scapularis TaxID=6945 RepID=B7PXL3_IXOSC|nr:secreted salivary gland peptide, putative [Ixodes scapularis]|eukprot:XP_002401185.1 secreted salivary gland peptide, putative [Ixodes scapularis]
MSALSYSPLRRLSDKKLKTMAARQACSTKAMILLVLCFILVCKIAEAGPQHVCPYPAACTNPGPPDTTHIVTANTRYNPTTKRCERIRRVTGPHDCQQFASLKKCKEACENTKE